MTMPSIVNRLRSLLALRVVSAIATVSPRGSFRAINREGWVERVDGSPYPPWLAAGTIAGPNPQACPLLRQGYQGLGKGWGPWNPPRRRSPP